MEKMQRLGKLRTVMAEYRIDGYIVTNSDPHFSEYLPDRYRDIMWLTGFTGSNALVFVTNNDALLWTDGRYFIQAEREITKNGFRMMKMNTKGYPDIFEYIKKAIPSGRKIGFNPELLSQMSYEKIKDICDENSIEIEERFDLLGEIWKDRPDFNKSPAYVFKEEFAGKSPKEKIGELRKLMKEQKIDVTVISSLEDVAWIYNLRGNDVKNNPVVTAYAIIDEKNANLYIDFDKLSIEVMEHLGENDIFALNIDEIYAGVNILKNKTIAIDKSKTSRKLYSFIDKDNKIVDRINLTTEMKAVKNDTEIRNQKESYIKDGVAITKFIYWLKNEADLENETEFSVSEKLREFRKKQKYYVMDSFDTIAAYRANAAMMHYTATEKNTDTLSKKGFLLVDSGGQYLTGTTDTTRTIVLGELMEEEKIDFTIVLKSHLGLLSTVFLDGTCGLELDAIARRPVWKHHMDYKCGTGHGVGMFLSVHEGPHRLAPGLHTYPLVPGMVVTIEPGIYKEGSHGIRTENVALVVEDGEFPDGKFYKFEVLSFVPIDLDAIIPEMLTDEEIDVLNQYHKEVYKKLSPYLEGNEKDWLKKATRAIKR